MSIFFGALAAAFVLGGTGWGLWQVYRGGERCHGRVLCSWCGAFLRVDYDLPKGKISSGICQHCSDELLHERRN